MAELVRINQEDIAAAVAPVLSRFPRVAGAYLFGSALGPCRPDSDIDLAVVAAEGVTAAERERETLAAEVVALLPSLAGHPFHVVALDETSPLFAFKVLREGKLIYSSDMDRITDVIERVSRAHAELYPRYRRALQEIMDEVVASGH